MVGDTAVFSVGATGSNLNFQWYFGGEAIVGANGSFLEVGNVSVADSGVYYCVVLGSCTPGDTTEWVYLSLDQQMGVGDDLEDVLVRVYPNPVREFFNIKVENNRSKYSRIKLFNLYGKVIFENKFVGETLVQVSELPAGIYLLEYKYGNRLFLKRVLVE